jgi:hypothetical protein
MVGSIVIFVFIRMVPGEIDGGVTSGGIGHFVDVSIQVVLHKGIRHPLLFSFYFIICLLALNL